MKKLFILILLLTGATGAWGGELAGVSMPDSAQVGDESLVLNGMGLRKKSIIKVYVAGLYLAEPSSDAGNILEADSPRLTRMSFLRGVKSGQLCGGWEDGLANNTPGATCHVRNGACLRFEARDDRTRSVLPRWISWRSQETSSGCGDWMQ